MKNRTKQNKTKIYNGIDSNLAVGDPAIPAVEVTNSQ